MKKLLAIILTFCLMATLFCGCGESETVEMTESTVVISGNETTSTPSDSGDSSIQEGTSTVTSTTTSTVTSNNAQNNTSDDNTQNNNAQSNNQSGSAQSNNNQSNNAQNNSTQNNNQSNTQSNSTQSNNTQNNNANASNDDKDAPKYDLKGATITVVQEVAVVPTSKGSTQSSKAAYEGLQKIQRDLNCKVSVKLVTGDQIKSDLLKNQLSGTKYADIVILRTYNMSGLMGSALTDMNTVKSMNLKKNYMNFAKVLDSTKISGRNYILMTPNTAFASGKGVFFNKSILKEIGYKENEIYDLAANGKWTIAKMREMAKKAVLDKDGKTGLSEKDRFGIIVNDWVAAGGESMLAASHVDMLTVNNGAVKLNTDSSAFANAVNLARDVYIKDGTCYGASSGDEKLINMFKTGHGLFMLLPGSYAEQISTMDADFGFVPFPTVDGKYETPINWNYTSLAIPSGLSDTEVYNAGAFLQAFCYLEKSVVETKYQEFGIRYFRDDQSLNFLKISNESQKLPISSVLATTSYDAVHQATYTVLYQCIPNTEKSITSLVSANKGAAQKQLDEIVSKFKK